jgi:hypothetical protein
VLQVLEFSNLGMDGIIAEQVTKCGVVAEAIKGVEQGPCH